MAKGLPVTDELPKDEAERRARDVAGRMLTTPKKSASQKRGGESRTKPLKRAKLR